MDKLALLKKVITHEIEDLEEEQEDTIIAIGGIIESAKRIFTKKSNAEMAFLTLANERGIGIECVVFPKVFLQYKELLIKDNAVLINGRINSRDDKRTIIVERISTT